MNYQTTHRAAAAALVVAAVTMIGACGPAADDAGAKSAQSAGPSPVEAKDAFDGLTGPQISDRARAAIKSVTSMRVVGDAPDGDGGTLAVNMAMDAKGSCRGTISRAQAGTVEVIKTGDVVFMKGDEEFWRESLATMKRSAKQTDATVEIIKGRWMKVDQKTATAMARGDMCDLEAISNKLGEGSSVETTTRGADVTHAGQALAVVYDRDGYEVTTVHVAKTGKPYPVEIATTGGTEAGSIKLSEFDKPVDTTPPPADQILDPSKLRR
ncbi:hypothetical protein [Streptomyces sp. NPDC053755]|uniref:hypothetical protein n=1 Tax=Streptomyces sp. NPDC053755 TaxID=3155815 RepID=UPI0034232DC3